MKRLTKSERRKQIRRFDALRDDQTNTTHEKRPATETESR